MGNLWLSTNVHVNIQISWLSQKLFKVCLLVRINTLGYCAFKSPYNSVFMLLSFLTIFTCWRNCQLFPFLCDYLTCACIFVFNVNWKLIFPLKWNIFGKNISETILHTGETLYLDILFLVITLNIYLVISNTNFASTTSLNLWILGIILIIFLASCYLLIKKAINIHKIITLKKF